MKAALLICMAFLSGICGPIGLANASPSLADTRPVRRALDQLCGETLIYDIGFLWFDRLAVGTFSLEKTDVPERYRAVLKAQTMGVAAWLTSHRVQRYASELQLSAEGTLRPVSHNADIYKTVGNTVKTRLKHWAYDYTNRQVIERVTRNGRQRKARHYSMGEGPFPYDILGAFYNFRAGLFGPLRSGAEYRIPAFAKGVPSSIDISVLGNDRYSEAVDSPDDGLVVKVTLDPEVFDTGDGNLFIWFDNTMRPVRVVVKDVIGLGDVRAILQFDSEDE